MQPLLAAVPISSGRLVPWMATRPFPPANSLSRSEYPVMGNTIGPRNAPGVRVRISSAIAKWSLRGVSVPGFPTAIGARMSGRLLRNSVSRRSLTSITMRSAVEWIRRTSKGTQPRTPFGRTGSSTSAQRRPSFATVRVIRSDVGPSPRGAIGWSTVRAFADVRGAVRAVTGTSTRPTQASFGVGGPGEGSTARRAGAA